MFVNYQAIPPAEPARRWHYVKPILSVVGFVLGVTVSAMAINTFVFQSYYVEGSSMTPTLHDHDRLIIDKVGHSIAGVQGKSFVPERGDIIVLNNVVPDGTKREQLIKRVIGLPGERVVVEKGSVTVYNGEHPNGFAADKELGLTLAETFSMTKVEVILGQDEVFVLGDNRGPGGSLDSRTFGPVKTDAIEGRLWARIFPLTDVTLF